MGVMRIKEEAMFCNLPKEIFFKSLGMLKQNWVVDMYCIVFASVYSFHLCNFVYFFINVSFWYLLRGITVSKT